MESEGRTGQADRGSQISTEAVDGRKDACLTLGGLISVKDVVENATQLIGIVTTNDKKSAEAILIRKDEGPNRT